VAAIIAMANHLHIEVVAEGIEGYQQLEKLRQLGCHYAQGYLFARPAMANECMQFLNGEPLNLTQRLSSGEITTTGEQVALRA
jgi:EAL domain-containing protein (putative c-di-GMP-specific phosphodiesterase class I)